MTKSERHKSEARLQALLAASDVLAILVAVLAAYALRFHSPLTGLVPVTKGIPPRGQYVGAALVIAAVWVPTFAALGLYRVRQRLDLRAQCRAAARGVGWGTLVVFALSFFYRDASFSRVTLLIAVLLLAVLVPVGRAVVVGRIARRFFTPSRLAVAGSGPTARALAARLLAAPEPSTRFVGRYGDDGEGAGVEAPAGALGAIPGLVAAGQVDRVILALDLTESARAPALLAALAPLNADVEWIPDCAAFGPGRSRADEFLGMPSLVLGEFPLLGWNGAAKRTMDLVLSAVGLVVLAPFFAALALLIKASGRGPVFYGQDRVGRDGRRFRMLKFRTMVADAEDRTGPIAATRGDARVTPIGRFLRSTSLDELPQLVNVLRGEMSLVGPRPERPVFIAGLAEEIPDYLCRQRVKSGMTGWAQIHGLRGGDSSMDERVRCDLYYIENWSLGLDIRILLRTLLTLHRQRNAY
jgi:exopolysaccharide biosynthesis polyprenyl glycosylphosphotransferase